MKKHDQSWEQRQLGRILVADDEEEVRDIIARDLEDWWFTVETVKDGYEALVRLERDPLPDLFILDIFMPHMDGFQVRERMLQVERLSTIPVVLKSSHAGHPAVDLETHSRIMQEFQVDGFLFLNPPGPRRFVIDTVLNVLARRAGAHGTEPFTTGARPKSKPDAQPFIVIATDDEPDRRLLAQTLRTAGYKTQETVNGKHALAEVSGRNRADGLISDLVMPRMDAFELREHLLADRKLRNIPFIVLVERPVNEGSFLEAMSRLDYDAFLFKPLTPETPIVPVLENVLRRRRTAE